MDPATSTSDSPPQRAPSSEPPSTRPNPFDDGEVAARKRRRTSGSGDSLMHPRTNGDEPSPDQAMTMDQTSAPRTPEDSQVHDSQRADPPSSSKVTINLRKALSAHEEYPAPPPLPDRADPDLRDRIAADAAAGVENELEQSRRERATSLTGSSSPPIELVQDGDDEDLDIQNTIEDISLGSHDIDLPRKIQAFPFRDPTEQPHETVDRLVNYISNADVELRIFVDVGNWLDNFVRLCEIAGPERRDEAFDAYEEFFFLFSKTMQSMLDRRPQLHLIPECRDTILEFYSNYIRLTTLLVGRDVRLIQYSQALLAIGERRQPQLRGPLYLEHISTLIDFETFHAETSGLDGLFDGETFSSRLESLFGDSPQNVFDLTSGLVGVLPSFPVLMHALSSITNSFQHLLRTMDLRSKAMSPDPAMQERVTINRDRVHQLWPAMEACFQALIEKSVAQIDKSAAYFCLDRLSGLLCACARVPCREMVERVDAFTQSHPQLPNDLVPDAMQLEWKLDATGKLIRCSQMQLRVVGASNMCRALVALWKYYEENPGHPILQHTAAYLNRSCIIDYILGANSHPAIINESINIVGFLAVTRTYEKRHTDQLWDAFISSQDPRSAEALGRLITGVMIFLDMASLGDLCAKIDDRPYTDFTPSIWSLVEYILKHMLEKSQKEDQPLTYQPYALCIRLLRESTQLALQGKSLQTSNLPVPLVQRLKELIKCGPEAYHQQVYETCLEDVSLKTDTTLGSLWCLTVAVTAHGAVAREMQALVEAKDFARLLVEELEHAVASSPQIGSILFGQANKPRIDFLFQLLRHQPSAIGDGLGERLWDVMVGPRCLSLDDREIGWKILNDIKGDPNNPYIQSCYSTYLPKLPSDKFCDGTLKFIKDKLSYLLQQMEDFHLDDEGSLKSSCLEQLWRLVLEVPDRGLAARGIHTLAREVYIESVVITSYPSLRARQVHTAFVNRCLLHLKEAARLIQSSETDEAMNIEEMEAKQERIFSRSLQLLTYFLAAHQASTRFSAPDLRPFMSQSPSEITGDLAQLKYQSFDGVQQTDVKPLVIGRQNTAASLLASIRQETGFPNYRAYFRGRPFLPTEREVCKSLEDLQIGEGLFLVKREEEDRSGSFRYRPGSSPLQAEILQHFPELAGYLEMKGCLGREVSEFLRKLPVDISVIEAFEDPDRSHFDVFPSTKPYFALYTAHALLEYKEMINTSILSSPDPRSVDHVPFDDIRRRVISLLMGAIQDPQLITLSGSQLELELVHVLLHSLFAWITDQHVTQRPVKGTDLSITSPQKFISILSVAIDSRHKQAELFSVQAFSTLMTLSRHDPNFWASIASDNFFEELVGRLILFDPRQSLRFRAFNFLRNFNEVQLQSDNALTEGCLGRDPEILRWLWELGIRLLPRAVSLPSHCSQLMEFISLLTDTLLLVRRDAVDLGALAKLVSQQLLSHETTEDINHAKPFDPVPRGLVLILLKCLKNDLSLARSPLMRPDVVYSLFWQHLFPTTRADNDQAVHRVVLNTETRSKLGEVLLLLSQNNGEHYVTLLQCLNEILPYTITDEAEDSPYYYEIPGVFDRERSIRAPCGYAGLRNLSNTCYLNSLLTQLYMNTGFRNFLMGAVIGSDDDAQAVLREAQRVFGCLQESYNRFIDPEPFVSTIKQYDGCPIDITIQMDVDEFYNLLFDRIEAQLLDGDAKKQFRELYGGQLVQQIKSRECSHISERLESFSAIQLDIKGKRCLEESLQAYVEGEVLEGDNKYKCSTCDEHVDAVKRTCLKDLPDNVIFHLKRFDFNLFTLQRSKINDYFSFPEKIDLSPYTVEHLSDPTTEGEDIFELVGILVHTGTSESGHYYSYIRERPCNAENQRWLEFNDDVVTDWDPANMEAAAFGGPDDRLPYDTGGVVFDKPYSAYMLFYERSSKLRKLERQAAASLTSIPVQVPIDSHVRSELWDENTQIIRRHCLFDLSHIQLVRQAFELQYEVQVPPTANGSAHSPHSTSDAGDRADTAMDGPPRHSSDSPLGTPEETVSPPGASGSSVAAKSPSASFVQDLAMEVALSHLDQVVSRNKDVPDLKIFVEMLEKNISQSVHAAQAYYKYFYLRPAAFRSLLQRSAEREVRFSVGQQFLSVLRKICTDAPQYYTYNSVALPHRPIGVPVLNGVMHILKHLWQFFHLSVRSWNEYFGFILGFAKMGDKEVAELLGEDYVLKLCQIITVDRTLALSPPYSRLLTILDRRNHGNRPPPYQQFLLLLEHLLEKLAPRMSDATSVSNATDRLSQQAPFSWTSTENIFMHNNYDDRHHSFFMEKLLKLDEEPQFIAPIMLRLVQSDEWLDNSAFLVLAHLIRPSAPSHLLKNHLELASLYLQFTVLPNVPERLISHITEQFKTFHPEDVFAACRFYNSVLKLRQGRQYSSEDPSTHALALVPDWAPMMLMHVNSMVRQSAVEMLDEHLFDLPFLAFPLDHDFGEDFEAQNQFDELVDVARRLGIGCLEYLRDVYVSSDSLIRRQPAETVFRVIKKCQQLFSDDTEEQPDRMHLDFQGLQREIAEPLRRLVVDLADEDGTDWEADSPRSEPLDEMAADMNLQVINELGDAANV